MMKKDYEEIEFEVTMFTVKNVITTSNNDTEGGIGDNDGDFDF